jgi:hypothetical protein
MKHFFVLACTMAALLIGCSSDNKLKINSGTGDNKPLPAPSKPTLASQTALNKMAIVAADFAEMEMTISSLLTTQDSAFTKACPYAEKDHFHSTDSKHFYTLDWRWCRGSDFQRQGLDCATVEYSGETITAISVTSLVSADDVRAKKGICLKPSTYMGFKQPIETQPTLLLRLESSNQVSTIFRFSRQLQLLKEQKNGSTRLSTLIEGQLEVEKIAASEIVYNIETMQVRLTEENKNTRHISQLDLVPQQDSLKPLDCGMLSGTFIGAITSTRLDKQLTDQTFEIDAARVQHVQLGQGLPWPNCKSDGDLSHLALMTRFFRNYKF